MPTKTKRSTQNSFLKIHHGPIVSEPAELSSSGEIINDFFEAFDDATGWRIDSLHRRHSHPELHLLPSVNASQLETPDDSSPTVTRSDALRLAQTASEMAKQLKESRAALRRQEMELASRAAIIGGEAEQTSLADKIETVLADAATACRCEAAAIYLLDEDTQHVKTRAVFGLPLSRLDQPPRELRGSRGDLEALVQNVVCVENFFAGDMDLWNAPEQSFTGGIIVALCQGDVPIGTLWLYSSEEQAFEKREQSAAKMAASLIVAELTLASRRVSKDAEKGEVQAIHDVAQWQYQSLPTGSNLAIDWRADGMLESNQPWATGWHNWDILPDGTIMLAMAESIDPSVQGAIQSMVTRTALASHCNYRHSPSEMMKRINDTLWQTNSGDQLVSMLYLHLDPDTGEGVYASAGNLTAMISSEYGYRPLVSGTSEPLCSHIDARPLCGEFTMLRGETLLAYNQGCAISGATQSSLGDRLRSCLQNNDPNPLAAIRRDLAGNDRISEQSAMTLMRMKL